MIVIANLQDPETGTFAGDGWGEKDTRFLYGAFNALSLLGLMHMVDVDKAVAHVKSCENIDGAFGTSPGAESHSGQVFTCVGALAIAGRLDLVDADKLGGWLSERQLPNGGLNGRPEKLEDVCYSWWVMTSMAMIDRLHWIDQQKIASFILSCQVCIVHAVPFARHQTPAYLSRTLKMEAYQTGQVTWSTYFTPSLVLPVSASSSIPDSTKSTLCSEFFPLHAHLKSGHL